MHGPVSLAAVEGNGIGEPPTQLHPLAEDTPPSSLGAEGDDATVLAVGHVEDVLGSVQDGFVGDEEAVSGYGGLPHLRQLPLTRVLQDAVITVAGEREEGERERGGRERRERGGREGERREREEGERGRES